MPSRLVPLAVVGTVSVLVACSPVEPEVHVPSPAVEIVEGAEDDDPKTLTLTADAVRRLELETEVVRDASAVPYSAVLYDKQGAPWVYTGTGGRTFVRVPVTIDEVVDDVARVSAGPPPGTVVVTRAAIKLYGAETGVGGGH